MIQINRAKRAGESYDVDIDFTSYCDVDEYIATVASTTSVYAGVDPSPSIAVGVPDVLNKIVRQRIAGGLPGVIYKISVAGRSNRNNIYVIEMLVAVIQDTDE